MGLMFAFIWIMKTFLNSVFDWSFTGGMALCGTIVAGSIYVARLIDRSRIGPL